MRRLIAAAVLLAASSARADDADEAKKLLEEQVRALNAGDAKAFAATFAKADNIDGAFLILPTAADEATSTDAIEGVTKHWLATAGKLTLTLDKPHYSTKQMIGVGAWFDADLVSGTTRYRVSGMVARTMVDKNGEAVEGPFKMAAEHISEAADDKAVLAAAAAGKLPALPKLALDEYEGQSDPATVATVGKHVNPNHAVSLIGTAAKERALGRAQVAKLVAGWKSLKLKSTGRQHAQDRDAMWGFEWSIAHVDATFTVKGKPVTVPYRALMIVSTAPAVAVDHGAPPAELLHAHFSVASH